MHAWCMYSRKRMTVRYELDISFNFEKKVVDGNFSVLDNKGSV